MFITVLKAWYLHVLISDVRYRNVGFVLVSTGLIGLLQYWRRGT